MNTLYNQLIKLLLDRFKLKSDLKNSNLKQTHLLKKNRKSIAKIKMLIKTKK